MKIDSKNDEYRKWAKDVIVTGERLMHVRDRKKFREKGLAWGNSAAVEVQFTIDPEDYIDQPLLFDMSKTTEDKVFDWLISNMSTHDDIYYIEHEEGSNVFRIRKDKQ